MAGTTLVVNMVSCPHNLRGKCLLWFTTLCDAESRGSTNNSIASRKPEVCLASAMYALYDIMHRYIYMHMRNIYIYIYIYTYTYIYIYTHKYINIYIYIYIYTHVHRYRLYTHSKHCTSAAEVLHYIISNHMKHTWWHISYDIDSYHIILYYIRLYCIILCITI